LKSAAPHEAARLAVRRPRQMLSSILIVPGALLLLAAASDLRRREIPDAISIALAATGLAHAVWAWGIAAVAISAAAAAACFAVGLLLFSLGQLGGGDVKLIAATIFWLPADRMLPFLLLTAIAGGVVCLAAAAARFATVAMGAGGIGAALRAARATAAPYATAIAAGGLLALPWRGV
jgi:prepilin peptidase CpaA